MLLLRHVIKLCGRPSFYYPFTMSIGPADSTHAQPALNSSNGHLQRNILLRYIKGLAAAATLAQPTRRGSRQHRPPLSLIAYSPNLFFLNLIVISVKRF